MLCSIDWLLCRIALIKAVVSWRTDSKATVSCPRTPILWMLFKTRKEINIKHRGESLGYFPARLLTFGNRKDLGNVSWAIETTWSVCDEQIPELLLFYGTGSVLRSWQIWFLPLHTLQISQMVASGPHFDCWGSLLGPYFIKSWVSIRSLFLCLDIPGPYKF